MKVDEVRHTWETKWFTIKYSRRTKEGMGRFGGGWQWEVGFQADARFRTILINLLVASIRITRHIPQHILDAEEKTRRNERRREEIDA